MSTLTTFRFGNSAFFINGKVITNKEGCLRIILLRANGIEMPIQPQTKKTFALGHANEEVFIENYIKPLNCEFEKEKEFLNTTKEGTFEVGHCDIIAYNVDTKAPIVFELKSVSSINSHKEYVLRDKWKTDNLAQLINYMHLAKSEEGYLVYSSYIWGDYFKPKSGYDDIEAAYNEGRLVTDNYKINDKGVQITPSDKFYKVTFDSDLNILIDGNPSGLNKKDVLKHKLIASRVLKNQTVHPERPESLGNYSPCGLCPFKDVCLQFDQKLLESTEDFLSAARELTHE
jgi:hypothetical protein